MQALTKTMFAPLPIFLLLLALIPTAYTRPTGQLWRVRHEVVEAHKGDSISLLVFDFEDAALVREGEEHVVLAALAERLAGVGLARGTQMAVSMEPTGFRVALRDQAVAASIVTAVDSGKLLPPAVPESSRRTPASTWQRVVAASSIVAGVGMVLVGVAIARSRRAGGDESSKLLSDFSSTTSTSSMPGLPLYHHQQQQQYQQQYLVPSASILSLFERTSSSSSSSSNSTASTTSVPRSSSPGGAPQLTKRASAMA